MRAVHLRLLGTLSAIDHDGISARFHIGPRRANGIVHTFTEYRTLIYRNDHEIASCLSILTDSDLVTKVLDAILRLRNVSPKE